MMKNNNIPWRITIDTNPYLCNLKCIMCAPTVFIIIGKLG